MSATREPLRRPSLLAGLHTHSFVGAPAPVITSTFRPPDWAPPRPPTASFHIPATTSDPERDNLLSLVVHLLLRIAARRVVDSLVRQCAAIRRAASRTDQECDALVLALRRLARAFHRSKPSPVRAIHLRRFRARQGRYPFQRCRR